MEKTNFSAAVRAGRWLLENQVVDPLDANNGRFLYCVNLETGYYELSTGWQTGVGILALLKLAERDRENSTEYLESAKLAVKYILSLQYLAPDKPEVFGAFREETPQTQWLHPRDSVTCAWALAKLYEVAEDEEYLVAAERFACWHLRYAWKKGWPVSTVQIKPSGLAFDPFGEIQGNFQCGSANFFMLLTKICKNNEYTDKLAKPLLEYYCDKFLSVSGRPYVLFNPSLPDTYSCDKPAKGVPEGWLQMHRYNDDFAALALLRGSIDIGKEEYLHAATNYLQWLEKQQNPDGSFGKPVIAEVASSCVALLADEYRRITSSERFETMRQKALKHLLTMQQESSDKRISGAFLGLDNKCRSMPDSWVNIRNTSYAILACLKS